ncbi:AAA family ATPase [Pseudofrankia inefficax]|uniref:Nuclease SbcCD subunit C n=1 Tax=Pseudofrankia inefficax (strain DSM 45817 / CECT 9037 / DDB 130130 / EuI1c) TaxID=298654 RepID=E3IW77_PSEI1|nr:AAA family ATPase [Pseudofrankia inefficax]ADP78919.1 exonuclease SbcC [Pseudofrankia inefficax]
MRPVLLEMAGFGSFRDAATVDFADADYFALVGPTGSGKSTVFDAMTFALFGSVPRWNHRGLVSLALAPTVARGTVRLVFDAAGNRYVVARELRRLGNGSVTVRNARLERLADPAGLAAPGAPTEVVAADSEVSRAVETLLGLSFEHFCACVVLPQGEFAEFLHAKPADRQKILTRLLGLGVYDEIRAAANEQAKTSQHGVEALDKQLAGYEDATEEAARTAAARVETLAEVVTRVDAALGEITTKAAAAERATTELSRVQRERDLLATVRMPADVVTLTARLAATAAAAATVAAARLAAERVDSAARSALAAAPDRAPLEQARRDHAELGKLEAAQPGAQATHAAARTTLDRLTAAVTDTRAARDAGVAARDEAARAAQAVADEVARLRAERDRLAAVRTPQGVVELASRLRAAQRAAAESGALRRAAEQADIDARAALDAAPNRAALERARDGHDELARLAPARVAADTAHADARRGLDAAVAGVEAARHARDAAAAALERAQTADLAAALRPHLVAGEPCPVCEQAVATLPAAVGQPVALAAARSALDRAAKDLEARERRAADAGRAEYETRLRQRNLVDRADELHRSLAGQDAAGVAARLAELTRCEQVAARAARELAATRVDADAAGRAAAALVTAGSRARAQLVEARDPLVGLGAPGLVDGEPAEGGDGLGVDLAASWARLVGWAGELAGRRSAELGAAAARDAAARDALSAATAAHAQAASTAERAERDQVAALHDERTAANRLESLNTRVTQLRAVLTGLPSAADVTATLTELDRLAENAKAADEGLRAARAEADAADAALHAAQDALRAAQSAFASTRDTVVALGAPALGGQDLLADWTALTRWAATEATARDGRLPALGDAVTHAGQARDETAQALVELLTAHGIPTDGLVSETAARAASAALERARAQRDRVAERRAEAAGVRAELVKTREAEQVAHQLGVLLRSDRFQRWLVAAALDLLVEDASRTLLELSNGQFELTHDDGDFIVIDHADADSQRPVRTLSGGETFQASLALALALSAQLTTMAATGAARLDSIFLDEGFGTLDDATLDTVASTLENLAGGGGVGGGRMVGIVTHVQALAERVPVRFAVSRDERTSTVVRETA